MDNHSELSLTTVIDSILSTLPCTGAYDRRVKNCATVPTLYYYVAPRCFLCVEEDLSVISCTARCTVCLINCSLTGIDMFYGCANNDVSHSMGGNRNIGIASRCD